MKKFVFLMFLLFSQPVFAVDYLLATDDQYVIGVDYDMEYRVNNFVVDETDNPVDFYMPYLFNYPLLGDLSGTGNQSEEILDFYDIVQEDGSNYLVSHSLARAEWNPINTSAWRNNPSIKTTGSVSIFGVANTVGRSGSGTSKAHGYISYSLKRYSGSNGYVAANFTLDGTALETPTGAMTGVFKMGVVFGDNSIVASYDPEKHKWYVTRKLKNSSGTWTHNNVTETINSTTLSITNTGYTYIATNAYVPYYTYVSDATDPRGTRIVGPNFHVSGGVSRSPSSPAASMNVGVEGHVLSTLQASVLEYDPIY